MATRAEIAQACKNVEDAAEAAKRLQDTKQRIDSQANRANGASQEATLALQQAITNFDAAVQTLKALLAR